MTKDLTHLDGSYLLAQNLQADNGLLEELDGLTTGFDKVKIPAGGGLMFEVLGDNGEPESVKEIEGVVLFHHAVNSLYKDKYAGGNQPPDCGSYDGNNGEGNPGGSCEKCPYNQFGSGDGSGKACKNKRRIFILRQGELFPVMLSLPTGSLKEFTQFVRRMVTKGKRSHSIVTKITLKKAMSGTGIQFSQAMFSMVRDLSAEELNAVLPLVGQIKAFSMNIAFHADAEIVIPFDIDRDTGELLTAR